MPRHLPDDDEDNPAVDEYNVLRQGNELGQGERNYIRQAGWTTLLVSQETPWGPLRCHILRCYCWFHHSRAVTFTQLNIQLICEL